MQRFYPLRRRANAVLWLLLCTVLPGTILAQTSFNPLAPVLGFNVFTSGNLTAGAGDTHGPVAMGGDLILAGSTIFTMNTTGTYPTNVLNDDNNYGMVIGGKIHYQFGNNSQMNKGYLRIANITGSQLWYADNNGHNANLKITQQGTDYSSQLAVQTAKQHSDGSATLPHHINFAAAFNTLRSHSLAVKNLYTNSACATYMNFITIGPENNPKIYLVENKINYIELTTAQLTALTAQGSITFEQKPAANRLVVFNITGSGTLNWQTPNLAGIDEDNGDYMLWNFYGLTGINMQGGNSVYGSILAPDAAINKTGANNTNGQIASLSMAINYGEIHYRPFKGLLPDCPTGGPLAVRNLSLNAAVRGPQVILEWKASGEENMLRYEVERSFNGSDFTYIGQVAATGAGSYNSNDVLLNAPVIYYRVTGIENTGKRYVSPTAAVRPVNTDAAKVWPTRVQDNITIAIKSPGAQQLTIQLTDMTGRTVQTQQRNVAAGNNQFSITGLGTLAPGIYTVKISGNTGTIHTQKIVR